ncbi:hypothetical protein E7T06_13540 [Deinococcus sp. Arct2-2]|uniref:hypothetical protein n=1 Tax=Deinococcus sp. Arct2-2 TaxID=2568653 RepID=UPI0010A50503|nr:hypothetical protein [Deinococcus sp. Arct2-2]THF69083.1 hypothetical protein E7T06_13540 [Deinococcus sp. Arct2-2]
MKRIAMMALVSTLALSACNQPNVVGNSVSKDFSALLNTASGYTAAAGTAVYVDLTGGDRRTVLTATGLKANTAYIAHFHSKGTAAGSTNDCTSGGPVVGGKIGGDTVFSSDADGKVTIKGFQTTADLKDAAYINIHESGTPSVIPLCADI